MKEEEIAHARIFHIFHIAIGGRPYAEPQRSSLRALRHFDHQAFQLLLIVKFSPGSQK